MQGLLLIITVARHVSLSSLTPKTAHNSLFLHHFFAASPAMGIEPLYTAFEGSHATKNQHILGFDIPHNQYKLLYSLIINGLLALLMTYLASREKQKVNSSIALAH